MVTAADAGSLGAAQGLALGDDGFNDVPEFLTQNRSDAQFETATPELKQWLNLPAGPTGPTTSPIKITLSKIVTRDSVQ